MILPGLRPAHNKLSQELVASGFDQWLMRTPDGEAATFMGMNALRGTVQLLDYRDDPNYDEAKVIDIDLMLLVGPDLTQPQHEAETHTKEHFGEDASVLQQYFLDIIDPINANRVDVGSAMHQNYPTVTAFAKMIDYYTAQRAAGSQAPLTLVYAHGDKTPGNRHQLLTHSGNVLTDDFLSALQVGIAGETGVASGAPVILESCNDDTNRPSARIATHGLALLWYEGNIGVMYGNHKPVIDLP